MITTLASSLKNALNRANLQSLTALFELIGLGNVFRALSVAKRGVAPGAVASNPYVVASGAQPYTLPDDAKAKAIDYVYARKGTGTAGLLTVDTTAATAPAAGHCKIAPTGDILFASADAWTSLDIVYVPEKQDTYEISGLSVASNAATIPASAGLAVMAMEIQSLAGTKTGALEVLLAGGSPSTGQACLSADKTQVLFASADAVTSCRVKLGVASAIDLDAVLEAATPQI
jgi:hypothetical protein